MGDHRVTSQQQLDEIYPRKVAATSWDKETPIINATYRKLIEAAPFLTIASVGPEGMDCSPRGDGPGFVHIIDDGTIAIPDRRGNNRLDTIRNIVGDERVALLFLIPGFNETLRINGRAHISVDPDLLKTFSVNEKLPASAIIVEIDTIYFQCARALKRAGLWDAEAQVDPKSLPSAGELVKSVVDSFDAGEYDKALPARQKETLY
ncbi:MAG: hypothetical protein COC23_07455 [Hyphomicrobiales bacterium]|nr:MAG: hypothetical protein COC23_07455 [Hyphomicrobiales bacterium]